MNEAIGGYDNNGELRSARSVADPEALAIAYRSGRVNQGAGGYGDIPVVDIRNYVDDEPNVHQYLNTFKMRARLDRLYGNHDNQVMFRAKGGPNTTAMNAAALDLAGRWLDAIAADTTDRPQRDKVIANKPADGVDACWTGGGVRTDAVARVGAINPCEAVYPAHSLPANQAGKPLDSLALKCQLKPLNFADYGAPGPAQRNRLTAMFPEGVCDWSQPGVGEQALAGTWQEFGPERTVKPVKPKLGLKAKLKGKGRKARIVLDAKLRPCPAVGFQPVVFEQQKRGKWRKIGTGVTGGGKCRAKLAVKAKGGDVRLRARFESAEQYKSARSKKVRVKVR